MRKQWIIRLLAIVLVGSLGALPAMAVDESGSGARTPATAAVMSAETSSSDTNEDATTEQEADETDAEGTVSFQNLDSRVRNGSLSYLSLQETIESINVIDFDQMQEDIWDSLNDIAQSQWMLVVAGLSTSYTYQQLEDTHDSLKDTYDDLQDGSTKQDYDATVLELQNAQNQVIQGVDTMYVAILELENKRDALARNLNALDRTITEMELRYELGQVSELQLQQSKSGRASLESSLQTLEMNISNYKYQLEVQLGLEQPTGSIMLIGIPDVTQETLSAMNQEADLASATEKSYELYAAKRTLDDAQDTYEDARDEHYTKKEAYKLEAAEHTYQAAQYTYQSTVSNFTQKFKVLYAQVNDYWQILSAAETALSYQQSAFAATETKYELGNISENDYLSAQDTLEDAKDAVRSAKRDLFSAYHSYEWAVGYGLLN